MATSYKQEGYVIPWTNGTGSAVSSGDVVAVGVYGLGIATVDIANGGVGSVALKGVFELPKGGSLTAAQGAALYWSGSAITATTTDDFIGYAFTALTNGPTTCQVLLAPISEDPELRDTGA